MRVPDLPRRFPSAGIISCLSGLLLLGAARPSSSPAPPLPIVRVLEQAAQQYHAKLQPLHALPPDARIPLPRRVSLSALPDRPGQIWAGQLQTQPLPAWVYILEFRDSTAANRCYRRLAPPPFPAGSLDAEPADSFYWSARCVAHGQWVLLLKQTIAGRDGFNYSNLGQGSPHHFYALADYIKQQLHALK
jgi:hypothetical protein